MKRQTVLTFIIILLALLLVPKMLTRADAPPMPPCFFYGKAYVDGKPAQDGLNLTAVISGATPTWTTQTNNGTYQIMIPNDNASTPEKDGGVTGNRVQFYVQGTKASQTGTFEPAGVKNLTLTTFSGTHVVVDQAFVSNQKAGVDSVQTVGFHAKWGQNDLDVAQGILKVQGVEYLTNATGWISFHVRSSKVEKQEWNVTSVNCSGVTTYVQTAPNPSIVWDRIKIVDGGLTRDSIAQGETVTVWFKAAYEYDNTTFDSTNGSSLYVNGSALTWSTSNNRWEYNFTPTTPGTQNFIITSVSDVAYGLTAVNDAAGIKTLTVLDQPPLLAGPLLYGILAAIIIVAGSLTFFLIRRKGYRLKVEKQTEKKTRPTRTNRRTNHLQKASRNSKQPTP